MNVFARIAAGLGAVVFTATAVGLPDACRYFTVHALSAPQAAHVAAHSTSHSVKRRNATWVVYQ
jgi:hypothetical protein